MTNVDSVPLPRNPSPDPTIHLAIDDIVLSPEGGAAIDFTISASTLLNPSAGYQLWSEDGEGNLSRHSSTKEGAEMHLQPFGTRRWWARVVLHSPGRMRFFAARERENPRRASDYVEITLPIVPAPTEFSARDGGMKVIATGKVRPGGKVRLSVAGQETTVTSAKSGQWTAILDAPMGTHEATAVALGGILGESDPVSALVTVAPPPKIPLLLHFPEHGRKITRITRVTGSATPKSEIRVSLGDGPWATATANPGGAWEVGEARSDQSGAVILHVENLSTGEVLERPVEVEYFPQWDVSRLIMGPLVDENGLVTQAGAIAEGTGEPFAIIEFSADGRDPWIELATADEDGRWRFEHLASPPPPPIRSRRIYLRSVGDPVKRLYTVETQAPIVITPREGEETGTTPVFSGIAPGPFQIELEGGNKQPVRPNADKTWRIELGPFTPGVHTFIARGHPAFEREITRRTILVVETGSTEKSTEGPAVGQ